MSKDFLSSLIQATGLVQRSLNHNNGPTGLFTKDANVLCCVVHQLLQTIGVEHVLNCRTTPLVSKKAQPAVQFRVLTPAVAAFLR